jgi:hypothetical protein
MPVSRWKSTRRKRPATELADAGVEVEVDAAEAPGD